MDGDTNKDRQDNEKAALKAIYGDQLTVLNINSVSWNPLECILTLGPQGAIGANQQNYPAIDLHIICPEEYPSERGIIPTIKLEKWKRIANQKIIELQHELESLAKSHEGEVIFELAQHIEKFLSECIQPEYESFYDEMIMRNKTQEEKERQKKQADDEKRKLERKLEIYVKEQAVKKALKKRQNSLKTNEEEDEEKTPPAPDFTNPDNENNEAIDKLGKDLKVKLDYSPWNMDMDRKSLSRFDNEFEHLGGLGKGAFGDVIKVRNRLDDGLYAIKRIELNPAEKSLCKKMSREVKLLSRLNHENVVRYYNSWIETADAQLDNKPSSKKNSTDHTVDIIPLEKQPDEWTVDLNSANSDECSDEWIMFRDSTEKYFKTFDSEGHSPPSETLTVRCPYLPTMYLYIQMELCDKSTLRIAIDNDLYMDLPRVWRLFREIVEGLCHIHQQGIIHRDLKPVNIFIGNEDHVKIGDFGLATTIILQKQVPSRESASLELSSIKTDSSSIQNASHTDQVGTALYVAPELKNKIYTQKVDIFSLGIIFYEMCHPPMATSSERFCVLSELRNPDPVFSQDFPYDEKSPQQQLVRWMLQHEFDKRPTSQELIQSTYIPPQKIEDKEVADMIRRTLSNPQTKNYNFLISSCFKQPVQPSLDATYNIYSSRSIGFTSSLEVVSKKLRSIFHNHGASTYLPPLLTPAGQILETAVCLMTRAGSIVHATYDLQMPFARYLALGPNNTQFKRYAIDKTYRERPAGVHPKESYECAFDIVTPTSGELLPEYETLCVIWEILTEFPSILSKNCTIYLNHSYFLSTMIKLAGLDDEKFKDHRQNIFLKKHLYATKQDFESFLEGLGLPEKSYKSLMQWLEIKGSLTKVYSIIFPLLKNEEQISLFKSGYHELETIVNFCDLIGISCPILVNLGYIRNGHFYSGLMIQVQINEKVMINQPEQAVLLQGGRYDNLVHHFRESLSRDDGKFSHFVAGFTLSLDKFLYAIENEEKPNSIDVLICAMGNLQLSHDKLSLLRDIWKSGVKMSFIKTMESLEALQARCRGMGIPVIVVLKDTEMGCLRIKTLIKDRYTEKRVPYSEVLDYIIKNKISMSYEASCAKNEVKTISSTETPTITFVTVDKLNHGAKRRYENQVLNNLSGLLQKFSTKVKIEILASTAEGELLKAISHHLDSAKSEADLSPLLKRYPKQKKIIHKMFDYLEDEKKHGQSTVVIIYSLQDNVYKVLL